MTPRRGTTRTRSANLADRAPVAEQSPQLLAVLGARLRAKKLDAVRFLERVVSAYPGDFWVNVEMGNALCDQSNSGEAIGYYRTALALRPETVSLRYALGDLYLAQQRWDGAIAEYEQAVRLDPENAWCHNRLGFTLAWKGGRDDEAIAQFREAIRLDANIGWSHYFLAIALENKGRLDEAVDEFREAARLLPEKRAECEAAPARAAAETGARRRGACRLEGGAGGSIRPSTTTGSVTPSCACSWETKRSTAAPAATCWRSSARPRTRRSPSGPDAPACCCRRRRTNYGRPSRSPSAPWPPGARDTSLPTRIACSPRAWRGIARAGLTMPSS